MEKKENKTYWMMTTHKGFVRSYLEGEKSVEFRRSVPMGVMPGDVLLVCQEGTRGKVVLQMTVVSVAREDPDDLWAEYFHGMQINYLAYQRYTEGCEKVAGIKVRDVVKLPEGLTIHDFSVDRVPQWFRFAWPKERAVELMSKGVEIKSKKIELDLPIDHIEMYKGVKYKVVEDEGSCHKCAECAANKRGLEKICYLLECEVYSRSDRKYVHWEIVG